MAMEEIPQETWLDFKKKPTVETRNFILMHYVPLVKEIASRLAPAYKNHIEYDDLFSSGIFGLMDAIEKYDMDKGIRFSVYASWRIKGAMIDHIREQDWLPRSMRQKFKAVEDAYNALEKKTGRFPSEREAAQHLCMSVNELQKIMGEAYYYQVVSMEEQFMNASGLNDSGGQELPEEGYIQSEFKQKLIRAIGQLTPNERMVTSLYYFDELNQKEIAKVMGLTESRISQLHSKALLKLKVSLSEYLQPES